MDAQQQAPDLDGAVKIGNVVQLLGGLTIALGLVLAVATLITGSGPLAALVLLASGVVSGFVLMALGAITKVLAHIARQSG